jgi:hypothetical protein
MPVGIFRDPKMNQRKERNYGIIWSADKSRSFYYKKNEDDWTRFALFGEVAEIMETGDDPPGNPDPEDYKISGTVKLVKQIGVSKLSPVYSRIGKRIAEQIRRNAIRDAIEAGELETDFSGPPTNIGCLAVITRLFSKKK